MTRMKNRNYWVISPNVKNNNEVDDWRKFLAKYPLVCMGWSPDDTGGGYFYKEMKIDDVVIVAQRQSWNWNIYSLGVVGSNVFSNGDGIESIVWEEMPSESWYRKLSYWISRPKIEPFNGYTGQIPPAIWKLTDDETIKHINTMITSEKKNIELNEIVELLEFNKNLILTGAPGTGKTFLAKQIAEKITESQNNENEQSDIIELDAFITWMKKHPKSDGNSYSPNVINGYRSAARFLSREHKGLNNVLSQIEKLRGIYKPKTPNDTAGNRSAVLSLLAEYSKISKVNESKFVNADKGNISFVQFHPSYDYTDFVEGLRPIKIEGQSEIGFELKNGIFKEFCIKAFDNPSRKYVLIIDEINRAEISKVFGELFFSIDPGYRGIKGRIKTQYANMQTMETAFAEEYEEGEFFVPENVYIIGTMNDIDRSVESFDFAMRRRFTWIEITAEQSAINMSLPESIKDRMLKLNEQISKIDGFNPSYHIGAAYFLDSNGNVRQDIDSIWRMRIEPLLKEYLRGLPDSIEKINSLKNAFIA